MALSQRQKILIIFLIGSGFLAAAQSGYISERVALFAILGLTILIRITLTDVQR